jgi:hypothetical protein
MFILFVKDKFVDVLSPLVIFDFIFISIKIIHYFSYIMKNALFLPALLKQNLLVRHHQI